MGVDAAVPVPRPTREQLVKIGLLWNCFSKIFGHPGRCAPSAPYNGQLPFRLGLRHDRHTKGPHKNRMLFWRPYVLLIWAIGELRNRRNSRAISRISELTDRPEMWCRWDAK
ncbi:MAG: hypothetical protein CME06_11130 [Gemmatimonadetes bacterium]|nr:hypothetical protein [Gemmatimonadota bacterium]